MDGSSGRPSLRSAEGPIIQEVDQEAPVAKASPAASPAWVGRRVPECTCLRYPSMRCALHGETPERRFEVEARMHLDSDEERLQQ
eukprot:3139261-Alexandrium_andersonii.AAC.1